MDNGRHTNPQEPASSHNIRRDPPGDWRSQFPPDNAPYYADVMPPIAPGRRHPVRNAVLVILAVVITLALIAFFVAAFSTPTTKPAGTTVGTSAKVAPTTTAAPIPPAVAAAPAPAPSGPATEFEDGTYAVGTEVAPGTYKSTGATPGFFELCSVSVYSGENGDGNVIQWKTANANEPMRLTVPKNAGSVTASGCEPFRKV